MRLAFSLMFVVVIGLVILVGAVGDKIARWGGYAEALPLIALLVLFVVGQMIVTATLPDRKIRH